MDNSGSGVVQVFVGEWSPEYEALSIKATKQTSSAEIVECIIERLGLVDASVSNGYELAEVVGNSVGQECKERRLGPTECPVALMLLWPKSDAQQEYYRSVACWRDNYVHCTDRYRSVYLFNEATSQLFQILFAKEATGLLVV